MTIVAKAVLGEENYEYHICFRIVEGKIQIVEASDKKVHVRELLNMLESLAKHDAFRKYFPINDIFRVYKVVRKGKTFLELSHTQTYDVDEEVDPTWLETSPAFVLTAFWKYIKERSEEQLLPMGKEKFKSMMRTNFGDEEWFIQVY